jgi:hypothetical protein
MEESPLLSRIHSEEDPTKITMFSVKNAKRTLIVARIIAIIGVLLSITVLVSRSDQIGTRTSSSFKHIPNLQGTPVRNCLF